MRVKFVPWLLVLWMVSASSGQDTQDTQVQRFEAISSLGGDSIRLMPAKKVLNMMVMLECEELKDYQVISDGTRKYVRRLDGSEIRYYPEKISIRFSIGPRMPAPEPIPIDVATSEPPEEFQSGLQFRLRVFHGMQVTDLEPNEATMTGVPLTLNVYHLSFELRRVPVEDRMMLEVMDRNGKRVGKFLIQLM